jgi:hypothetical protein
MKVSEMTRARRLPPVPPMGGKPGESQLTKQRRHWTSAEPCPIRALSIEEWGRPADGPGQ